MNLKNISNLTRKSILLTLSAALIVPALGILIHTKTNAAAASIKIYSTIVGGSAQSTNCKFVMSRGSVSSSDNLYDSIGLFSDSDFPIYKDADSDPAFKQDLDSVKTKYNDAQQLIFIYMAPTNTGSDNTNTDICTNYSLNFSGGGGLLFSRPSNPTKFFGYLRTSDPNTSNSGGWMYLGLGGGVSGGTNVFATYNPQSKSISIGNSRGAVAYSVIDSEDSAGITSDAAFTTITPGPGTGGGGSGYCSSYLAGPDFRACYDPQVIDFNTISFRGEKYTLRKWGGSSMEYYLTEPIASRDALKSASDGIRPVISLSTNGNTDSSLDLNVDGNANSGDKKAVFDALNSLPSQVKMSFKDYDLSGGKIDLDGATTTNDHETITVKNVTNLRKMFKFYPADGSINFIANNASDNEKKLITGMFTSNTDVTKYLAPKVSDGCTTDDVLPSIIFQSGSNPKSPGTTKEMNAVWSFPYDTGNCSIVTASIVVLIGEAGETAPPAIGSDTGADDTVGASQSCEDLAGDFGVIACWILKGVDGFLGLIENIISSQLEVSSDLYSVNGSNEGGLYDAWRSVARIASALIAIIALIMVAGTALGDYKAFSSYTVKKVLPRLVIASIAIWLSWPIATSYINLMNVLGKGVADLLWTPFANNGAGNFNDWGLASAMKGQSGVSQALTNFTVIGGLATAGLAAGVAVISGGVFALLSSLVPVLIFMLIGFAVLVLRKALIIFLLVLAPVAIAAWVLPNTESMWKKWSKLFNQLLIMFPLFMGVLAAGKIFSYITWKSGGNDFLSILISVIGYITPFVLLPGIFKSSGGALSKVTGALNKQGSKYGGKISKPLDDYANKNAEWKKGIRQAKQFETGFNSSDPNSFAARRARAAIRWRSGQNVAGKSFAGAAGAALSAATGGKVGAGMKERGDSYNQALGRSTDALQREAFDKAVKEEDLALQKDTSLYSNKDELERAYGSATTSSQKQAIVDRLVTLKGDKQIRNLQSAGLAGDEIQRSKNSGKFAEKFSDSAPDLVKPSIDAVSQTGDSVKGWTSDTWGVAISQCSDLSQAQHYVNLLTSSAAAGDSISPAKLSAINTALAAKSASLGVGSVTLSASHIAKSARS